MSALFVTLYKIHPIFPLLFLVVLANGMLGPVIYHAVSKVPYNIKVIRVKASEGSLGARYAYYSWLALALASCVAIVLTLIG